MKKILVTGYNGFIGKHMTRALAKRGYMTLGYDLDNTEEELIDFINQCDVIVHLAGINRPLTSEEFYNGNSNFTKKLIDFVKASGRNIPVIMSSSIQAELDNDYGKSKKMGEDFLFSSGLPVYVFRLANVFGKWCRPNYNSAAATFMYNIAHNLPIEIRDPNYVVHYNYVEDIVNTFVDCIDKKIKPSKEILYVQPTYDCSLGHLTELINYFKKAVESDEHLPIIKDEFEYKLFVSFMNYLSEEGYSFNYAEDTRGSFEEIYKSKKYGQISLNKSFPGITKGGHYHTYKKEVFMTVQGECLIRLRNINSSEIEEFHTYGKDSARVLITPNKTHDIRNVGNDISTTIMWISEIYDDATADTFRADVDVK